MCSDKLNALSLKYDEKNSMHHFLIFNLYSQVINNENLIEIII